MSIIARLFLWIWSFLRSPWRWRRAPKRRDRFRGLAFLQSSEDPTAELDAVKLVLIGPPTKPKWLRFRCPCGCGDVIALNLMTSHYPHWTVEFHRDSTLTAHPSIDAKTCGSHFWIRRSAIHWV